MEYLDKIIPLAVLGAAAAFLVILLRRVARENAPAPCVEEIPAAAIATVEPMSAVSAAEAPAVVPPVAVPTETRPTPPRLKKVVPTATVMKATPIETVLGLLKDKDSLAAALVLHEILGPAASKRPHGKDENGRA